MSAAGVRAESAQPKAARFEIVHGDGTLRMDARMVGPISSPHPGPLWQLLGYTSEDAFLDDTYRNAFGHEPPPRPTTRTQRIARLDLPGVSLTLDQRQMTETDCQGQVLDRGSQLRHTWILQARLGQPRIPHGLISQLLRRWIRHDSSPSLVVDTGSVGDRPVAGGTTPTVTGHPDEPCWGDR